MNLKSSSEFKKKMPPIFSLFLHHFVYVEGTWALASGLQPALLLTKGDSLANYLISLNLKVCKICHKSQMLTFPISSTKTIYTAIKFTPCPPYPIR